MEFCRIVYGMSITFSFFCLYVDNDRLFQLFGTCQSIDEQRDIVAVDRTNVRKSHILKEHSRNKTLFDRIF